MMKKIVVLFVALYFVSQTFAQVGLVAGLKTFNPADWNAQFDGKLNGMPYSMTGWQVGLDYWFRLKKRRIEFAPELSFSRFERKFDQGSLAHFQAGFHFNTDIYLFDLASDCNCPTFSKDGNFFAKGFFLELSPGLVFVRNKEHLSNPPFGNDATDGDEIVAGGSIGAGLDFGFSDLFTVTPLVRVHYYPDFDWEYDGDLSSLHSDLKQFFIGLRIRLHFKEFKKARYH